MCSLAQTRHRLGTKLTNMEARFHFLPWHCDPSYVAEPYPISQAYTEYFAKLKEHGIELSPAQKAWYVSKAETQFEDMKREFPPRRTRRFEASVEGTYYGSQIARAEMDGRIGSFPPDLRYAVNTAWDIGVGDATAIWFFQYLSDSGRLRFLHYYEMSGEGAEHYGRKIRQLAREHSWPAFGYHFLPQDVAVREWGTNKTRVEQLIELGIRPSRVPRHEVDDGITRCACAFLAWNSTSRAAAKASRRCGHIARNGMRNAGAGRTNPGTTGPRTVLMRCVIARWRGASK